MAATVLETFKAELLGVLVASPLFGVALASIRRSHKTAVNREAAPALHVSFQRAKPVEDKSCAWQWEMGWRVRVFTRDDAGDESADPFVFEIVKRIGAHAWTQGVRVELTVIETVEDDIADEDAIAVDIEGTAKFTTLAWILDATS